MSRLRLSMIWAAIALVLSGLVALAIMMLSEMFIQPGALRRDFAVADFAHRWQLARLIAWADWRVLTGQQALPAIIAIIVGFFWSIRRLAYYAGAGRLALLLIPFFFGFGNPDPDGNPEYLATLLTFAVAGAAAGAIYWLLAGRWQTRGLFR